MVNAENFSISMKMTVLCRKIMKIINSMNSGSFPMNIEYQEIHPKYDLHDFPGIANFEPDLNFWQ